MLEGLSNVLTGFGLSASAGLNAYVPLLVVALLGRYTQLLHLRAPFDVLTSGWVIGLLGLLVLIEVFVDKVPAVDTLNDVIQTLMRPTAGAILFAASTRTISDVHPVLAVICGILAAGTVHLAKASVRPVVTATTAGVGNPILSTVEDVISAVVSVLSVLVPVAVLALCGIGIWMLLRGWRRRGALT